MIRRLAQLVLGVLLTTRAPLPTRPAPWVLERTSPLAIYGPLGIAAMTGHLEEAYAEDFRARVDGAEPANTTSYRAPGASSRTTPVPCPVTVGRRS